MVGIVCSRRRERESKQREREADSDSCKYVHLLCTGNCFGCCGMVRVAPGHAAIKIDDINSICPARGLGTVRDMSYERVRAINRVGLEFYRTSSCVCDFQKSLLFAALMKWKLRDY